MKLIPVVCSPSGSQIATYLYCGARLQAAHCTQLDGNKYELKSAANESKSKANVGKGIASPSLVPGAERGERECLMSTVCTCVLILGTLYHYKTH